MLTLHAVFRLSALLVLLVAAAVRAQTVSVAVMDAQSISDANARKVHRAAVDLLKQLLAVPVSESYEKPKKACSPSDLACQRERTRPAAVALWVLGSKDTVIVDAVFWLDGERLAAPKNGDASLDALDFGLKPLLDAVVPGWMKRGWGGLQLAQEPPSGTVLKLDGRVLNPERKTEVVPVTAGSHQLDLLFPDGRALLQRLEVSEATRMPVGLSSQAETGPAGGSFSTLRLISYAAWMVGTASLLSAFIFGFVGRTTANGQNPCTPGTRGCVSIDEAQEQSRRSKQYAFTANVLLGTGLAFSLAGAGLFTFDVVR